MTGQEVRDGSGAHIVKLMKITERGLSFTPRGRRSHRRALSTGVTGSVYIYSITLAAVQGMNCKITRAEMGKLIAK